MLLMMTYANNSPRNESPILTYYEVLLEYLGWKGCGTDHRSRRLAYGCN